MTKKKIVVFFAVLVFFVPQHFSLAAKKNFVGGSGQFYSKSGDSLSFVKKYLLYLGFRDVITNSLKDMEKSPEDFWVNYDQKFEEYFQRIKSKLDEKHEVVDGEPTVNKQGYYKSMRYKRLNEIRKFGNLDNVIESYVVKRMSRSAKDPNMRFIDIEARVNEVALNKLYFDYIRQQQNNIVEHLYVAVDFNLENMSWSTFASTSQSEFRRVIMEYWEKWFRENIAEERLVNIHFIPKEDNYRFTNFLNQPPYSEKELAGVERSNAIFTLLSINIQRVVSGVLGESILDLKTSGSMSVFDLYSKKNLFNHSFNEELEKFENLEGASLSTAVANYLYRKPLSGFLALKKSLSKVSLGDQRRVIRVRGLRHMDDSIKFLDLLSLKGMEFSVQPHLKVFGQEMSEFDVFYQGGPQTISFLLERISRERFTDKSNIDLLDDGTVRINFAEFSESTAQ